MISISFLHKLIRGRENKNKIVHNKRNTNKVDGVTRDKTASSGERSARPRNRCQGRRGVMVRSVMDACAREGPPGSGRSCLSGDSCRWQTECRSNSRPVCLWKWLGSPRQLSAIVSALHLNLSVLWGVLSVQGALSILPVFFFLVEVAKNLRYTNKC